ncbi:nucleoporin Nup186/Nup192/Nup205 [Plectosphaerella cucumerina]|uniref:Nucleoporin Nup186/Nup192/Nup205 n=1 Tax=Plectosphaerella cucumerina TaxID=40658 RepID=A0A8K0WZC8_9PEZI|nr:nucleoporin Nup186/Nup192/Nup205 [Plectosphaerella cucumerina]
MADVTTLEALQFFHRDLLAIREGRPESAESFDNGAIQDLFKRELARLWQRPARDDKSRQTVKSGVIPIDSEEYRVNEEFQQIALSLADEAEINEIEAARYVLEAEEDTATLGRPLLECAIIRFHQQRKYVLDSVRLLFEIDDLDDDELDADVVAVIQAYLADNVLKDPARAKLLPRCVSAMQDVRSWLSRISDKMMAAAVLASGAKGEKPEGMDTLEFSRISLVQQHELLAVVLARTVEKKLAEESDFKAFLDQLKRCDRYDVLLVHLFPVLGAYITTFGSTEGIGDIQTARRLQDVVCRPNDDETWPLVNLQAAVKAWWLSEYSGWYLDDAYVGNLPGVDVDSEDEQRSKQFFDALKDGGFDFVLSILADMNASERQDPSRVAIIKWLGRKTPAMVPEPVPFSDFFKTCLSTQLEVFVDAFISNLPDVLRRLRTSEDEQRQLGREQHADLERFLVIIAMAYEGRPSAATNFWSDPDSNLAGFMHWASRRASTPLVTAFCDMLQAVSGNQTCATAAHEFLLDEGHHASGKMRRSQSLTWQQIFRELTFFANKTRDAPPPGQSNLYRPGGRPNPEQVEAEPESEMMLQAYLGLITRLTTESETAKQFLIRDPTYAIVDLCYQLASSPILPRIRASVFTTLAALLSRKSREDCNNMWLCLENWMSGGYVVIAAGHPRPSLSPPEDVSQKIGEELCASPEEGIAFVRFLTALVTPSVDASPLNDNLPFPESLGSAFRMPGIELYVDLVLGTLSSPRINDAHDLHQARVLRLSCLEFAGICLETFNEDLIILANDTSIQLDAAIGATDLATYVRLHPFARVMEWMFNDNTIAALFKVIHQDPLEVGNAAPDSPVLQGILRAVELVSKVLDLQTTYLDVVRPIIKLQSGRARSSVANAAYASFEDGLAGHLNLVVDLGNYCNIGHPDLTLACLKLLERMSSAPKITAAWTVTSGRQTQRNRAIIAMEANGDDESIARSLAADITSPFDFGREADSPNYLIKSYILDFLYTCLDAMPNQPTIAHLLLGFQCGVENLSVSPAGAFASRTSLFHGVLRLLLETPCGDAQGMRQWLVSLKFKCMRIMRVLWESPLSAPFVIDELRENDVLFHLLLRDVVIQPALPWEGQDINQPQFTQTEGASTLIDFLALRSMTLSYIAMELCSISQGRLPSVKRRIFETLNGRIAGDDNEPITIPTVFDLYDFLLPDGLWDSPQPELQFHSGLDLRPCLEHDADGNVVSNVQRVREVLLLTRNGGAENGALVSQQAFEAIEREEEAIVEHLVSSNRQLQIASQSLRVLRAWTSLLLVMVESNDFKGTAQTSFLLQTLQAILPGLELYSCDKPAEAAELAKLGRVLLFKLDLTTSQPAALDRDSQRIGSLVSDKLYQLFQIALEAVSKGAGTSDLRAIYYGICYRYLMGTVDEGLLVSERPKALRSVVVYGDRFINVVCDDAYGGDAGARTAAVVLLNALLTFSREEADTHVVEVLNRLNFIGLVVDSLRSVLDDWTAAGDADETYLSAKLALLLQLAQSRAGAKYVLHAGLLRAIELSGLFAADPELRADTARPRALERHYELLAKVTRVVGAAVVSRGASHVGQGQRFLTEHRMLVTHTLKRSAGIGAVESTGGGLERWVDELAEGFMVLIAATGFLEHENSLMPEPTHSGPRGYFT